MQRGERSKSNIMAKITVQGMEVSITKLNEEDYICLTDMMKAKDGEFFFHNWLRNRNTIEFLGIWEKVHNKNFNYVEFDRIKSVAGLNSFRISAKEWITSTNAVGLISKAGRYGGTYADEADVLNVALFGMTAKQWREDNPDRKGNIRDYASINELICLSNMENLNAVFINDGIPQPERLIKLNQIAIHQMQVLEDAGNRKLLK